MTARSTKLLETGRDGAQRAAGPRDSHPARPGESVGQITAGLGVDWKTMRARMRQGGWQPRLTRRHLNLTSPPNWVLLLHGSLQFGRYPREPLGMFSQSSYQQAAHGSWHFASAITIVIKSGRGERLPRGRGGEKPIANVPHVQPRYVKGRFDRLVAWRRDPLPYHLCHL